MKPRERLGQFLAKARQEARLTQADVAEKLGYSSPQFVSNWERGVSQPPAAVFPVLAKLYGRKRLADALERYYGVVYQQKLRAMRRALEGEAS